MPKRPSDPNERAFQIVQEAVGGRPKSTASPAELRASKGGRGRAAKLTAAQRADAAKHAAAARWGPGIVRDRGPADEDEE